MKSKVLNTTTDSRIYKITLKRKLFTYCYICAKRSGSFYYDCHPADEYGRHGSGKGIFSMQRREYRSWKYNRKNQWKE